MRTSTGNSTGTQDRAQTRATSRVTSAADVSLRDLEVFVMAARTQSLRETSRQLSLLPAHVSKIIKRLEARWGLQLFRRSVQGLSLTPDGLTAFEASERIVRISQEIAPQRGRDLNAPERVFTVGSIGFLCTYLLAPNVSSLEGAIRKPARFRLVEFTHNDLVSFGLKGAFDLALHIEELEWTQAWQTFPVGKLSWSLYGRKGHPLGESCEERDLLAYPFIVPTDWTSLGYLAGEDHCPLTVSRRKKGDEAATAETALELCRSNDQLTFVPDLLASHWNDSGMRSIRVRDWPEVEKEIFLSVRADSVPKNLVEAMVKGMRKRAKA